MKRITTVWLVLMMAMLFLAPAGLIYAQQSPTQPGQRGPALERGREVRQPDRDPARPTLRGRDGGLISGETETDVSVISGGEPGAAPRLAGTAEAFEAILLRDVTYGEVPDAGEGVVISLAGPMPVLDFLDALSLATGWSIAASAGVQPLVLQLWTKEVSPRQAVAVLKFNDIYYEYDDDTQFLFVMTLDEYLLREYGDLEEHEFSIRHADVMDVEIAVASLLSSRGRLIADPVSSKLLVMDTKDNLDRMERVIAGLDTRRVSRPFGLNHVDASSIMDSIGALLTEGGRLDVDPRSNTLIVTDRPERIERIAEAVHVLDQELDTRSWVLNYADPVEVAENLSLLVPEAMGRIVVNEAIHQITVTAVSYRLNEIDQRIKMWDEKRQQVQIEAYLATASRNILRDIGIRWSYATTIDGDPVAFQVGTVGTEDGDAGDGGLNLGTLVGAQRLSFLTDNFAAVIDTLDTSADATILAHPQITVQDGEEALFENTTQVPFASSTTTFGSTFGDQVNSNTSFEFIDVGTILRVTPRITSDQNVLLDIAAEDSSFVSVIIKANGLENTLPQKTQNKAETQVLVRSGQTIVLGGLRTSNFRDTVDRVPILGGLPIIGRAFRSTGKDHQDRELLIFLTPTIVDELTQPVAVKLAEFDDEVAATMRSDAKTSLGRIRDKMNGDKNEIRISIGGQGGLLAEGEAVSLEDLRVLLAGIERPRSKKVILRTHPAAPGGIALEILEISMERGFKIELDDVRLPIVPRVVESGADEGN